MESAASAVLPRDPGPLYWLWFHNKKKALAAFVVMFGLAILFREEWQPLAVLARRFAAPISVGLLILFGTYSMTKGKHWFKRALMLTAACAFVLVCGAAYQYVALWMRYSALTVEQLGTMPLTNHERVLPVHAVHSFAQGNMDDSKHVTRPSFVRLGEGYYWTMGVEPEFALDKLFGTVNEMILTPATTATLDLSEKVRRKVNFAIGEQLWLASNDETAAIRTFDLPMFFSYEPSSVRFLQDEMGKPIEVISLVRWRGILFSYPEFGGVIIIREQKGSTAEGYLKRVLVGEGGWVSPERVKLFPYLVGQNIMPTRVSEYTVESMRFMNGFFAPFPGYHQGDVRMPDLPEDMNPMPYATYFESVAGLPGMLYHYAALEPYLEGKHGLVASVLIPADGTPRVLVYNHEKKNEGLFGVSRVAGTVKGSKRNYNWETSVPVEHRPYVRAVDGKNKLFWLTTVFTYKDKSRKEFAGVPEVVITNPANPTGLPTWVDTNRPETWAKQLPR